MKALTVKIAADTKGFNAGIKGAQGNVQHFSKTTKNAMLGVAAATAGAVAIFSKWIDKLDHASKLAQRFDTSVESMQRLGFIAEKAGASIEEVADALKDSNIKAEEAMKGSKAAAEGFDAMGIKASEFINLNAQEKIEALADGFIKADEAGKGFAAAQAIVGGSAMKLLPLLRQGGDELRRQANEAKVVSSAVVKNAERMNDVFTTIKNNISGYAGEAVQTLLAIGIDIGAFIDKAVAHFKFMFENIGERAKQTGKVISSALTGDFQGAANAYKELGNIADKAHKKFKSRVGDINKARDLALIDLYSEGENKRKNIATPLEDLVPPVVELPEDFMKGISSLATKLKDSLGSIIKPFFKGKTTEKKEEEQGPTAFSSKSVARGQAISSLASHGGGRGFKGAMSGLTKSALNSERHLAVIAANSNKHQQAIIGA
jgi:hypothetical protein